jgi:putative nucleotidyltransferase with HDIG domain
MASSRNRTGSVPAQNCCVNCRAIVEYIRRHAPQRVAELFRGLPQPYDALPVPESFLTDENNWVPSVVVVHLFKNAREILADPDAAFKIGYESVTERQLGYIQRFVISTLLSPGGVARTIEKVNAKFNTTKDVEVIRRTTGRLTVRLHWNPNGELSKDICSFNKGIYAAIPTLWGVTAKVTETACRFEGAQYCEFETAWDVRPSILRGILRSFAMRKGHLLDALAEIERDKELLAAKYAEVHTLNQDLQDKLTKLQAINEASRILVSRRETSEFVSMTMEIILRILRFDRAILMLIDPATRDLTYVAAAGAAPELIGSMKSYRVPMSREHNLMVKAVTTGEPILVTDVEAAGLNPSNFILARFHPHSFCLCPLTTTDVGVIGVLGADRATHKEPISATDLDYLTTFANTIAVSLQRARLDEELKMSYLNSVRALVHALEEKDPYTKGHSERVASIAALIGEEMGLSSEELEQLRIGGFLHDIGKIGVPESIIKNPKSLSKSEFRVIQRHAIKGVEIIEPISFLRPHLHLIRHHHERYDGKGYPDGLKGDEIPVGARIMAVADTYDAMTSSRPYRKGLPPVQALRAISRESGQQFAPEVVVAFQRVFDTRIKPQ